MLAEQSQRIIHASNLYFNEWQARYAAAINGLVTRGKVFFTNSGAESDEALFKMARRHGSPHGRFEIITAINSFHGRTLAGIAATGQEEFRQGFGPVTPGFVHVPFNDLGAAAAAVTERTAAILIEGIQGEGGVHVAHHPRPSPLGPAEVGGSEAFFFWSMQCNAAASAPGDFKATNACSGAGKTRPNSCRMPLPWRSPWARDSRSGPFGLRRSTRRSWTRAAMARPLAGLRSPAPSV